MTTAAELMGRITAELSTGLAAAGRGRGHPRAPALVAVAHGSRDPEAVRTVRALLAAVRRLRPGLPVRLGHVELNEPLLRDTLGALTGDAVLVPLLFGRGHHVTRDIPEMLRAAGERGRRERAGEPAPPGSTGAAAGPGPGGSGGGGTSAPPLSARVAAPLGPHPLLAEALAGRLAAAGWRGDGVVLAAAGSRAARSAADTGATAALLAARLGVPVLPAYASAAAPTVAEAARTLAARGCRRIGVACCFTAPGLFASRTAADARALGLAAAAPLGAHPALARLVLHRYDEQLAGLATRSRTRPAA
ncbi:sirohydrochlorin chelatase [Streptomyces aculeolatus]|uniref:sirohydrochlorin chelatase n=1 Tax=Streptomyces aculeolatus TaxID=270689 RepID=UPI001CEDDD83|nr:CbiX/SirB N-terminal domain-containing protein [Streptomyces aculeolatus]